MRSTNPRPRRKDRKLAKSARTKLAVMRRRKLTAKK